MAREGRMTVLVVGGGGREHALVEALAAAPSVGTVHCAPGNAGTAERATNHPVSAGDVLAQVALAQQLSADLVVVGPEAPLVDGLADRLRAAGIACFGPGAEGARLEGSKEHAKAMMERLGVPTAAVERLTIGSDVDAALARMGAPWVIKRDGLCGGKGVTVTDEVEVAKAAVVEAVAADGAVLLEAFLEGEEASLLVLMDESGWVHLPPSQDHKRVGEGDTGPNTGGMGAYAPAPVVTPAVLQRALDRVVVPMHRELSAQDPPYRGCLYVGLMIDTVGEPSVVEFNVRFGDPECQVTLPLLEGDLGEVLLAVAEGRVGDIEVRHRQAAALGVVLASEGYPGPAQTGRVIGGLAAAEAAAAAAGEELHVMHAGTRQEGESVVSSGGRVLLTTGVASDLATAAEVAYRGMAALDLPGGFFREDIGHRAL